MLKKCYKCKKFKSSIKYYKSKTQKDGLRSQCIKCQLKKSSEYYWKNKDKISERKKNNRKNNKYNPIRRRRSRDKRKYKLNEQQSDFIQLLRSKGECCVCKNIFNKLYLDHNHDTGEIRGMLCNSCNTFEGKLKKQIQKGTLKISGIWADYLKNPPGINFNI